MTDRAKLAINGWHTFVLLIALGQAGVGIAMLGDGPNFLKAPLFEQTARIPWWLWGTWSLVAAALIAWHGTQVAGLALAALWHVAWASCLIVGIVTVDGPWYAIPVYLTVAALHVLAFTVETSIHRARRG